MVGVLIWGLTDVVVTPLETGEVYPPFSSLRSDPMGAKALYESLAALIPVNRLFKQRTKLADSGDALFVLGVDPVAWSALEAETIEGYRKLVEGGGRLVIGFLPVRGPEEAPMSRPVEAMWGIKFHYRQQKTESGRTIPRETALYFETSPEWRKGEGFVERKFGAGSVVLVSDTFALSNEGLRESPNSRLISQIVGDSRRVIFDENHFGVVETGSVVKLMRKYGLEGGIAVLAIVAALFIWRSTSSLLPPRKVVDETAIAGRDSLAGMTALLHRGVAEKDLMSVCFAEWSKMERNQERVGRVEDEIRGKSAVEAYRAASRVVAERKR
jgi:hypothetical protein